MLACALAGLVAPAWAQEMPKTAQVQSQIASDSRYEIVQAPLMARFLLRLDKVTGDVDQIVVDGKQNFHWDPIRRIKQQNDVSNGRPIYQIFMSGIMVRDTYLINTATGVTWQLVTAAAPAQGYMFDPVQ